MALGGFFFPNSNSPSANPASLSAVEYNTGFNFAQGGLAALGENLNNKQAMKETANNIAQSVSEGGLNGLLQGAKKSFSQGGDFDEFNKEVVQSFSRNAVKGSEHFKESLPEVMGNIGQGWDESVGDKSKIFTSFEKSFSAYSSIFKNAFIEFGGIYLGLTGLSVTLAYGIPLFLKMWEQYLNRPQLIIESSNKSWTEYVTSWFKLQQPNEMVFGPGLKKQLDDIVQITSTIHKKVKAGKTNVKYRNLMLYGPPGTGKTMFAKELARRSGLEYAFMSGLSFSKFKDAEGIQALDHLFAWANRSSGLLIFIDEAESFLSKRDGMDPQSKAYQLLNNFLNYTGERSSKFMFVFAKNHKDALDSAMYRRIDDLIEMPLPSKNQRIQVLNLYKDKVLLDEKQNGKDFVDSVIRYFNDDTLKLIAEKTKGFSYAELEGIINTLKTDADILEPATVNDDLIMVVLDRAIKKHQAFTNGKQLGIVED